jgi:hypothetical protein
MEYELCLQNSMLWSNQSSTKVNLELNNRKFVCRKWPLKIAYSCFESVARHSQN